MKENDIVLIKEVDEIELFIADLLAFKTYLQRDVFNYLLPFLRVIPKLEEDGLLQDVKIFFLGREKYLKYGKLLIETENFKKMPSTSLYCNPRYYNSSRGSYKFEINTGVYIEIRILVKNMEIAKNMMEYLLKNHFDKKLSVNLKNTSKKVEYRIKQAEYRALIDKNLGTESMDKSTYLSNKKIKELEEVKNKAEFNYLMIFEKLRLLLLDNIDFLHIKKEYQEEKEQFAAIIKNESFLR